jgi:hypothetical protein
MNACSLSLPVRPQHIFNFARHEDDQVFLDPGSFLESAEQWLINGSYLRRRFPYIPRQPFDGPFVQPLLKFVFVQKKVFHGHTILSEKRASMIIPSSAKRPDETRIYLGAPARSASFFDRTMTLNNHVLLFTECATQSNPRRWLRM